MQDNFAKEGNQIYHFQSRRDRDDWIKENPDERRKLTCSELGIRRFRLVRNKYGGK